MDSREAFENASYEMQVKQALTSDLANERQCFTQQRHDACSDP